MAANHRMTFAGVPMRVNPNEMRWNFSMKTADQAAVGGKVVQILGTKISDLTLKGQFSPDKKEGDTETWQQAERFRQSMKEIAKAAAEDSSAAPVRLVYPPRNWDFEVYIKKISPSDMSVGTQFALSWELTLFPSGGDAAKVVRGIKDLYIKRLMDGIGWKQTAYNGPMTQELVDEALGGLSAREYVEQGLGQAFLGSGVGSGF